MIKNILQSKLYVLCLMLFCSLVVSVFCFGISSKAYNGLNDIQAQLNDWGCYPTDQFYIYVNNYWSEHTDYDCVLGQFNSGQYTAVICSSYSVSGNVVWMQGPRYIVTYYTSNGNVTETTEQGQFGQYLSNFVNGQYAFFDDYPDSINWDYLIYSVNIPTPNLDVTYIPAISMLGGLPQTNNVFTSISVEDNAAFKIQLAVKISVADMVQIGLTDGTTTYKYLDWTDGTLSDIYSLQDQQDAENIFISNSDLETVWNNLYNSLYDDSDFPIFSSSVPFWNSNPNAQKYLDAQSYYRNNMARQMPMYGTRLEIFARYFGVDGNNVYVSWGGVNGRRNYALFKNLTTGESPVVQIG